jgi:hypothetical protein
MAKPGDVISQTKKAARGRFDVNGKMRMVLEGLRCEALKSGMSRRQGIACSA